LTDQLRAFQGDGRRPATSNQPNGYDNILLKLVNGRAIPASVSFALQ
jgi:hypothetical protein